MPKISDKLKLLPKKVELEEYTEIEHLYEPSPMKETAETLLRVAKLTSLDDVGEIKKEIYDGNVIIVDISEMKKDRVMLERALRDLKRVVDDVRGDIAEVADRNEVIITPLHIRIDRTRIGGK